MKDAYKLPIFNSIVESYRYENVEKLFKAKRYSHHYPDWLKEKITLHLKNGLRGTDIAKKILNKEGIAIRTKAISRVLKRTECQT